MPRKKRKLTAAEKAAKKRRREEYMTIFIHGKQKRVKRPPTIDGMDVDEFIRRNADPIWLHQNELWHLMESNQRDEEPAIHPDDEDLSRQHEAQILIQTEPDLESEVVAEVDDEDRLWLCENVSPHPIRGKPVEEKLMPQPDEADPFAHRVTK